MIFTKEMKDNIAWVIRAYDASKKDYDNPLFLEATLGIIAGECGFKPRSESCFYSPSRLKQIFSFLSASECNAMAFSKNKSAFFSVVYGPTKRGKGFLGNLTNEDGGRFYGRGLIQLTGRANYEQIGNLAGIDIVSNPMLANEPGYAGLLAVEYMRLRLGKNHSKTAPKAFFEACLKAVGHNSPDIRSTKEKYFEYFCSFEGKKLLSELRSQVSAEE